MIVLQQAPGAAAIEAAVIEAERDLRFRARDEVVFASSQDGVFFRHPSRAGWFGRANGMGVPHSRPKLPKFETEAMPPDCMSGEMRRWRAKADQFGVLLGEVA